MFDKKVLAIILGGGQGSKLYPLPETRSKLLERQCCWLHHQWSTNQKHP